MYVKYCESQCNLVFVVVFSLKKHLELKKNLRTTLYLLHAFQIVPTKTYEVLLNFILKKIYAVVTKGCHLKAKPIGKLRPLMHK